MRTKLLLFKTCVALFLGTTLSAQQKDLQQDRSFFLQQHRLYQQWLDHNGMGKMLHVKEVEVESHLVSIYLATPYENSDSVRAAWTQLEKDYQALNTGLSLKYALYYKMLQLMELEKDQANVQLFDTYNPLKVPCFYWSVFSKNNVIQVDSNNCRAKTIDIYFSPSDLKSARKPSNATFQKQYTQQYVFDKIHQYVKQRYERAACTGRNPKVSAPQIDGNIMRFEVTDLCKEVLKDTKNNDLCEFLNKYVKPCNWIQREKLTFTFIYQPKDNAFQLKCELEGKVGSGYYDQVGRGGYLDMEIDFDGYLTDYATKLQYELKDILR